MKSWRWHDEISLCSDEIFGVLPQMKSNPPPIVSLRLGHARVLTTHCVVIHCARAASLPREAISSTKGGFLPPTADLTEKSHSLLRMAFFLAGAEGLEPTTNCFGDSDSTN